jgi:small subunit ribosomal protein S4
MTLKAGDNVAVREASKETTFFKELAPFAENRNTPSWLGRDLNTLSGNVLRMPERAEIEGSLNEQLIVEYYSR